MAKMPNNPVSKGRVTGGNANPPSAKRYAQPKGKQSVGSGNAPIYAESSQQLKKAASPTGYRHNSSRPKGL